MSYAPNGLHWVPTKSGGRFYFTDPRRSDINISDIAAGLANCSRFAGQTKKFYSVAEHCYRVSCLVPQEHALQAMLHDASSAYFGHIPTPYKRLSDELRYDESKAQEAIYRRFRLPLETVRKVREADARIEASEARILFERIDPGWEPWLTGHDPVEGMDIESIGWGQEQAEQLYEERLRQLWKAHARTIPVEQREPASFWETDAGHIHWHSYLSTN